MTNTNDDNSCMLTTKDNPFDPFTQFKFWYGFDTSKRIIPEISKTHPVSTDCCAYLARIAITYHLLWQMSIPAIKVSHKVNKILNSLSFGMPFLEKYECT